MARWRRQTDTETPPWVMEAWLANRHDEIDPWLEDLHDRDPARWEVVIIELLSTPTFTWSQ